MMHSTFMFLSLAVVTAHGASVVGLHPHKVMRSEEGRQDLGAEERPCNAQDLPCSSLSESSSCTTGECSASYSSSGSGQEAAVPQAGEGAPSSAELTRRAEEAGPDLGSEEEPSPSTWDGWYSSNSSYPSNGRQEPVTEAVVSQVGAGAPSSAESARRVEEVGPDLGSEEEPSPSTWDSWYSSNSSYQSDGRQEPVTAASLLAASAPSRVGPVGSERGTEGEEEEEKDKNDKGDKKDKKDKKDRKDKKDKKDNKDKKDKKDKKKKDKKL